ncbi:type VI secretion system tip protein VgrG, partial [Pseudomonas alliivorans]|nr:type VI secretion system tip protein VgrG [Pseudomonas alliivorans]
SRLTEVRTDDHLTVSGKQHIKVGEALLADVGHEIHFEAGDQVVIEAGLEITLKVGGSFIKIDPGGVTVSGPLVKLNSGGAPASGSGALPNLPGLVKAVLTENAGELLMQKLADPVPLAQLCQKPEGGTPMDCPLPDCGCRKALQEEGRP